jgi:putative radical SAM enzyme (TIGR03279 family)
MVRIAHVLPGTIAEELELEIGTRVVRINGAPVRDGVDFRFLEADASLEVELATERGERYLFEIEKDPGEPLGVALAPDAVRQCSNKCVFCFIDGNPNGARRSLWLKDDDFRLSFTYGTYVTLTNLGERGFERLIEQRLSPLYVSVHATEPDVRMRLLGVARGGDILAQLRRLTSEGLEVHTQVVLCPGWNDGAHLDRTIDDLWDVGPRALSLSVVPVGLTRYNLNRPVRQLASHEAAAAIAQVERARVRAQRERDTGWAYCADEMFYLAGLPLPAAEYYDDWPLTENGVGAVRTLLDAFDAGVGALPPQHGRRIGIVTGTRMATVLQPLAERLNARRGAHASIVTVENGYFGHTVTTAGLLPGADVQSAIARDGPFDVVLIPAESLNDDDHFIDDVPFHAVVASASPAHIVAAHEITSALAAA